MIPKSIIYKLVDKKTGICIAEGNKKEMERARKSTPNTRIWLSGPESAIGKYFGKE